jgi:hypothetical protein
MTLKSIKAVFVHTRWSDQTCTRGQGKLAGKTKQKLRRALQLSGMKLAHLTRIRIGTKVVLRIDVDFVHRAFGL